MSFAFVINGEEVQASVNLWTLVEYEAEFGEDMVKQLFSTVKEEDNGDTSLDFGQIGFTTLAKMAWVCVRTEHPKTKPFKLWCQDVSTIEILNVAKIITQPMIDAFFRLGDGSPQN